MTNGFFASAHSIARQPAVDALTGAADHALYQAKAEGRNRCIAWAPPPPVSKAAE